MHCNMCGEEVAENGYLKHLRDYHEGENNLNIICPRCENKYTVVSSFQTHWYTKHQVSKRKSSSGAGSLSCSKIVCVTNPDSNASGASECSFEAGAVSDSVLEQQVLVITPSREQEHISELEPASVISGPSASVPPRQEEVISDIELLRAGSNASALPGQVEEASEFSDHNTSSATSVSSDSDSDCSDMETEEIGVPIEQAVKSVLPQDFSHVNQRAASYLLNLHSTCNIPSTSIQRVISETEEIIKYCVLDFASEVDKKLVDKNLSLDKIVDVNSVADSASKVFDNIRTVKAQGKYFKESLGVIEPQPIPLGRVFAKVRRKGRASLKTVVTSENIMFVPLTETIDKLLNHPDYAYLSEIESNPYLGSYLKGEKCKSNPVLIEHPGALRFILYYDDLEVCSPLKAKAGKHKLGAFYVMLDNIALKHRSNLSLIFLVALVNANYVKDSKYGMDSALEVIVTELKKFEKGVVLPSGKTVFGTLIATIGDNLGSHAIGGFKEGFTANCCCRYCMATYEQCQIMVSEDKSLLRTKEAHSRHCAEIQTVRGKNKHLSTKYGVNRDSFLNTLDSYHVVGGLPPDIMHDILEGALPRSIKNLLNHFLGEDKEEKKFTLDWLNAAIRDFDFGYAEATDKPSEIKKDHLKEDGSLHQSACQTWLLATILPQLIGPLLDKDDEHYDNFLMLLEICRIVFSTQILDWMVPYLSDLIENYLSKFISLYGSLIPKQHFLIHYPSMILLYGSLVNYMCMRCEAKHKFFKDLVYVINNYKNIPFSLSHKHELHMAATWAKSLKKQGTSGPCKLVSVNDCPYKMCISELKGSVIESNWLSYGGALLKPEKCYLCIGVEDSLPIFVKVFKILVFPKVQFVCQKVKTIRRSVYFAAYEVLVLESDLQVVELHSMILHCVLHAHTVQGTLFIPMKYCVGGCVM